MSKIGLVLGGGGVTGASHQTATLLAIEAATGWDPNDAQVVVGTSGGAVVAAMVRGRHGLTIHSVVGDSEGLHDYADRLRTTLFRRGLPRRLGSWARHGLLRGLRRPGLNFALGSPAPFRVDGIAEWIASSYQTTPWPERPTLIVAFDLEHGHSVAFGTEEAPDCELADAVAASCAVPLLYQPHLIDGRAYLDGGVASGTSADLVLGSPEPLDLLLVIAPMALEQVRQGRRLYEPLIDRAGAAALEDELDRVRAVWPHCEILVMRPSESELEVMRTNPMSPDQAIPSFFRTLRSLRSGLAQPGVWDVLERHLVTQAA